MIKMNGMNMEFLSNEGRQKWRKDLKVIVLKLNPGNILLQVKLLHYFYKSILPHIKCGYF